MLHAFYYPEPSIPTLAFFRLAYGLLLLGTLLLSLPHGRRFFLSERWGGYGKSSWAVDAVQNPLTYPLVMALWLASGLCIGAGWWSPWTALVNLLFCRYFFLHMRWQGVLRGMGAPGFMTCWLAGAVFLLEFCQHYASQLLPLSLLVLQADFALIMFTAGWYKLNAGYFHNEGMEYGLVNPQWSYWWWFYKRIPSRRWFFKFNNHVAWAGEVLAGVLMLIPATRFWGALFILLSFIYIGLNIRLLLLTEMVMLACVLFFASGTPGGELITWLLPSLPVSTAPDAGLPSGVVITLQVCLWVYLALLPVAYAGMFYNFYGRKPLPARLQGVLEFYTNLFGLILWRVFSADHTRIFILIYQQPRQGGRRTLISRWGLAGGLRYSHVGEAITVTSLFTTLKYYPSNGEMFKERLLRYARTIPCPRDTILIFEYNHLQKMPEVFEFVPVAEFRVDVAASTVDEKSLDEQVSLRAPLAISPVQETARPGSYAPLRK